MVLFLSTSFLRRLRLVWKSDLTAFLIGDRNLFFFIPDSLVEVDAINPQSIDSFYRSKDLGNWQLLGFLSSLEIPWQPGYAEVHTNGTPEPDRWTAYVHLLGTKGPQRQKLEIKIGSSESKV